MGDNAEFEKLSTLEARLAAALDRIAVGLGEAQARMPPEDPTQTSGAVEDALIRADTAEARVAELEAMLASQPAPDDAVGLAGERDAAWARAEALEAERDALAEAVAERDATIATLRGDLAAAGADAADPEAVDRLTAQVADLEARVTRLRAERAEAIAERDEARDIAEELQAAGGMDPDDRAMALRAEAQERRVLNERLTKNVNRLRGENATDPGVLNKALVVELDALRAARASEAAELTRILADLDDTHAGEGEHA